MSTKFLSYLDSLSNEEQKAVFLRLLPECDSKIQNDYPEAVADAKITTPVAEGAALEAPAAPAAPKKARKVTKAVKKTTTSDSALLEPVDNAPIPLAEPIVVAAVALPEVPVVVPEKAGAVDPTDPLKAHPSRLAKVDPTRCMARKPVLSKHVPGTHKDEGGVKKFHPEAQCSSKPVVGQALCEKCLENEAAATAGKRDPKKWFGRLDRPVYEFACVIGCKQYFEAYPEGIKGDPLSVPPKTIVEAAVVAPAAAKKAPVKKAKPAAPAQEVPVAVAAVAETATVAEWECFLYKTRPVISRISSGFVYEINAAETDRSKMAQLDKCIGRLREVEEDDLITKDIVLVQGNKLIDPYDLPEDDE